MHVRASRRGAAAAGNTQQKARMPRTFLTRLRSADIPSSGTGRALLKSGPRGPTNPAAATQLLTPRQTCTHERACMPRLRSALISIRGPFIGIVKIDPCRSCSSAERCCCLARPMRPSSASRPARARCSSSSASLPRHVWRRSRRLTRSRSRCALAPFPHYKIACSQLQLLSDDNRYASASAQAVGAPARC